MKVGVLALQGDVPEHRRAIAEADRRVDPIAVRRPEDLEGLAALVLPGGESTTIARLLRSSGLWEPLDERLRRGLWVLATCAGLILLSARLEPTVGRVDPPTFGKIDITVKRNDYGRQKESFEAPVRIPSLRMDAFPGVFIRAPRILSVGPTAEPLAWQGNEIVGVRQGPLWGLTFHPELSDDRRVIRAFLAAVRATAPSLPQ
jgi:5'-phosphate synthase pdxT subunit